jgi:hypothetical protein
MPYKAIYALLLFRPALQDPELLSHDPKLCMLFPAVLKWSSPV